MSAKRKTKRPPKAPADRDADPNAVETVKVQDPTKPGDYMVINAADFDPRRHARHEPED